MSAFVVAVDQFTGAFGVGFCPGTAMAHLVGLPCLGEVRYFINFGPHPVITAAGGGYVVAEGMPIDRIGGVNDVRCLFLRGCA